MAKAISKEPYTNRLINEKSPYLLQHAHNPVNWYPWGNEAFKKAKRENKPIFLSIGYSTCHWCHVMEEESFSNPEIAALLNEYFVSIKVDREERPDIDNVYMNAVTAMSGQGGWPLTVFLTPDKEPFYGGTYFPPDDKWGKPGLKTLLPSIAKGWAGRREDIVKSIESLIPILKDHAAPGSKDGSVLTTGILKEAYEEFLKKFDSAYGGFGSAPKFIMGHSLSFILRYWKRAGEPKALEMAEKTLRSISRGGIHDYIGGGFYRYSTDKKWHVPHFEKMLYDQAIISKAYLEAYQATGKEEYAKLARDTFEYLLRNMASHEGGFYTAEDADSLTAKNTRKKREGAFYIWTKNEIISVLGKEEGEIFCRYFGVKKNGNAISDPQGEFKGENILYASMTVKEAAAYFRKSESEITGVLKRSRQRLFTARLRRPKPSLDGKVLTDWNGLMISSLAFGSRVLNEPRYREAAAKAAKFISTHLVNKRKRLLHRYWEGDSDISGTIDDYAFFIQGLIDLYEASFDPSYLKEARRLAKDMLRYFWDGTSGGFFFTADDAEKLLMRQKIIYDGAVPSGNSIAALDLIRLAKFTAKTEFDAKAETLFKAFSGKISQQPSAYPQMLIALDFALGPSKEIVISGEKGGKETLKMLKAVYKRFIPNKIVVFRPPKGKEAREAISVMPFIKDQIPLEGKTAAYICENYTCELPVTSAEKMEEILGK